MKNFSQKTILISILLLASKASFSQENDSIKLGVKKKVLSDFPFTRMFNLEYNYYGSTPFTSKIFDEDFQEGKLDNQKELKLAVNIPIYTTQKWNFTGSFNYRYNEFVYSDVENVSNQYIYQQEKYERNHTFITGLNATYFSRLFKKPFIYNLSVFADGSSENGYERIKALVGGSLVLKADAKKTLAVGAVIIIDPTTQIPFFPTLSYDYRFLGTGYDLNVLLPQRILLRKKINEVSRVSIGSMLATSGFYVYNDNPWTPSVSEYSQLEIQSGLIYERLMMKNFIVTLRGGVSSFVASRLTEKAKPVNEHYFSTDQKAKGYFNIGLSYHPNLSKKQDKE
ncbi:hypothetical protein [Gelidibacter japonicus]|uniref:hypothetical protein n=1 Tax=Gelidibacter japonicus TaxID=1962232 RepID=UPI0013D72A0E|nr:hypothetical protein [Gelidibacter japonicus]